MELFDLPLEQAVLGACIVNNTLIDRAASVINPDSFYDPFHQRIFAQMEKMHGAGDQITAVTLSAAMKDDPGTVELGPGYFSDLGLSAPALPNIISLSRAIKEFATKRSVLVVAENISAQITDHSAKEAIETAERALYALAEKSHYGSRMLSFGDAITKAMKQAEDAQNNGGKIIGVPTGFKEIDQMLGGLQKSDLIIIAGRPGMGKTALATNMAFYAATTNRPGLFFSLEMSAEQLTARILSEQSGIESWRIRNGQMRPPEWDDYVLTGQKFREVPLHIDDT
ncbi:MAG: replicative DNA helicase, partial [Hyphomicrobiaceae bacterium]